MYMKYHIYLELRTKCKLFMKKDSPHIMKDKKKILHDETWISLCYNQFACKFML